MRFLFFTALSLVTLLPANPGHCANKQIPVTITDVRSEKTVSPEDLADALVDSDVIVIGEQHDNNIGHRFQLELIRLLGQRRTDLAISMEMFERDVQQVLNDYLAGRVDRYGFLAHSRPWGNYAKHYSPIIEHARRNKLEVIAANIPRPLASAIAKKTAPPEELKIFTPRNTASPRDSYRKRFSEAMQGHGSSMGRKKIQRYFKAQCSKDDAMAESILDYIDRRPHRCPLVVHLCGSFHSDYGDGVVSRLLREKPLMRVTVISMKTKDDQSLDKENEDHSLRDLCNYLVITPPNPKIKKAVPSPRPLSTVETIAGNGRPGRRDGIGQGARLNEPFGICPDGKGNIYVADSANHCIRLVTPGGKVTTVAGTGREKTLDGPALKACFKTPSGVRRDGRGGLYIFSYEENSIRHLTSDGRVESIIPAAEVGLVDGPLARAKIYCPRGLVVDSKGNLIFSDCWSHRIRKITPDGHVKTIAGSGPTGFDSNPGCKDGPGPKACFCAPCGITIDDKDNVYVADANNNRLRKVAPDGTVTTIAGTGPRGAGKGIRRDGPALSARLNTPSEVWWHDGTLYFSDTYNNCIRRLTKDGMVETLTGDMPPGFKDGRPAQARFYKPRGIVLIDGELYIADYTNHAIRRLGKPRPEKKSEKKASVAKPKKS